MAFLWILEWGGITPDQYDKIRDSMDWDGQAPRGLYFHTAAFDNKGLVLTELWQSPDHVQVYMDERLLPAVRGLGIQTNPRVDLYQSHYVYLPDDAHRPPINPNEATFSG
jgi:hypothetical protein